MTENHGIEALGLTFASFMNLGMDAAIQGARWAEELGYQSFWTAETTGPEAFSTLTAAGAVAPSLDLGTGVLALQLRTPPLVAMAGATLQALHPERDIILGVGISSPVVTSKWHGAPYGERPLARVREYLTLVKECLSGESVSFKGDFYEVSRFRLGVRLGERRPKVVIGALNPGMLKLAGERGQLTVVTDEVVGPTYTPDLARQLVALGRMRSQGVVDGGQYAAALLEKLVVRKPNDVDVHAEYAAEMVRQQVYAQYGELSYTTGLNVTTTLRAADQQAAYKALRRTLIEHSLRQVWRGPEGQESLAEGLKDEDPAVAQALADYDDDEDLRLAIVTRASAKSVTVVLASGEVITIEGTGLRPAQSGLADNASAKLRVRRGAVLRVLQQGKAWSLVQWPETEGALVAMDPANGQIRALVGGFDFHRNQFNHVTQGWRQPGSSYKPFIYSGAIENGMQPESLVMDAPLENVGDWAPENDDGSTEGPITLRHALARSKNLVSIRLMQLLSPQGARSWISRFGFDAERQPDNLTQALGTGSTNPLQLAGAYAVLANGGYRVSPLLVQRIARASGEVVFEAPPPVVLDESQRAIPARNAFMVSTLLQEVTRSGTAARAQAALKRPDLYGKTGTTNDVVDAWFAGYQPGLVAVVWVGFDTPRSLGSRASGSALALPAWIDYMAVALKGVPVQEVQPPDGVVRSGSEWRYAEWNWGGFIPSLGVDGQAISPALQVHPSWEPAPPVAAAP